MRFWCIYEKSKDSGASVWILETSQSGDLHFSDRQRRVACKINDQIQCNIHASSTTRGCRNFRQGAGEGLGAGVSLYLFSLLRLSPRAVGTSLEKQLNPWIYKYI